MFLRLRGLHITFPWNNADPSTIAVRLAPIQQNGLVRFSDAPLHTCVDHGYCGKQGQPHTQREFETFEIWQNTLSWVWPIGMVVLYVLNRDRIRQSGRK
jgi:hypothetical protein